MNLEKFIRDVPDFPKKGIIFKDITPLLGSYAATRFAITQMARHFKDKHVDYVAAIESRGFIFGSLLADRLKVGFIPIRKPGKLPHKTVGVSYDLEYGSAEVHVHVDAAQPGAKVLLVDDLLATGGTIAAACQLIRKIGGEVVGAAFLVELCFLNGRKKIEDLDVLSLIKVGAEK